MSEHRVWHPSRDAYHCAFRLLRLGAATEAESLEIEKARILDMYLLFPSLLYKASMPEKIRTSFREISVPKPDQIFIRLPSTNAVFQELRIFQNSAMAQLAARGLLESSEFKNGRLAINEDAVPDEIYRRVQARNREESGLIGFLSNSFGTIPLRGADNIYRRTGLSSRPVLA